MTFEVGAGTVALSIAAGKAVSKEGVHFLYNWNVDETLRSKLEDKLLIIRTVLEHAELKQIRKTDFQKLLRKVKVAIFDAEDLLYEISTNVLESFVENRNSGIDSKMREILYAIHPSKETIETRMRNLLEKLEYLINDMPRVQSKKIEKNITYGTGFVNTGIYGRNLDKIKIEKLLKAGENKKQVGVIPIVGMGGIGKTTVAKMLYNSNELKFDLMAWTNVTDRFDVKKITKALIESTGSVCNFDDLDLLQNMLKKILQGKKFLLVLDNICNENYDEWEVLKIPFSAGEPGSQIIVTTRNSKVGNMIGTVPFYTLNVLSDNDCWSVIEAIAFPDQDSATPLEFKKIAMEISKKCKGLPLAAITLGGLLRSMDMRQWTYILKSELWDLPVDTKILPSLLVSYDHLPLEVKKCFVYCAVYPKGYRFEMEELVLLWMAEDLLSEHGRNKMEDVGRMYFYLLQTQSFLQPIGISETEFVMHDLIHDLAQFFSSELCFHLEDNLDKGKVHEQCRRISHYRREDDVLAKFESITSLEHLRSFLTLRPLRCEFHYLSSDVISMLSGFKQLKVLSLSGYLIYELPESIGSLRHLRYLNLSHSFIKCLPDAVKKLYNLQTLILSQCHELTSLHADLGSLTKLRHIDIAETSLTLMPLRMGSLTCLHSLSDFVIGDKVGSGIGELQNLHCLQGKLHISGLQNIVASEDARDAVLSNKQFLHELILEWSSEDLEKHELEERVLRVLKPHANLKSIQIINFHGSEFPPWMGDSSFNELVSISIDRCRRCGTLPSFGRLPSLKKLVLKGLDKVKEIGDDIWGNIDGSGSFPSLQILRLQDMKNLRVWTSLGKNKMFTCLEELQIIDCPKLLKLTYCFPYLTKLQIERCGKLTGIWKPHTDVSLLDDFKFLRSILFTGCPELKEIPKNIFELELLAIDGCDPEFKDIRENVVNDERLNVNLGGCELIRLSKLQKLFVYDSEMKLLRSNTHQNSQEVLTRIPINQPAPGCLAKVSVFCAKRLSKLRKLFGYDSQIDVFIPSDFHLPALKLLELCNVRLLDKLPETLIRGFPKLEELKISHCPNLVSLATEEELSGFPFLKSITIKGCQVLQALPVEIVKFAPSVEYLFVDDCERLAKLPFDLHKLNSLQNLAFTKCNMLKAFPDTLLPSSLKSLNVLQCQALKKFNGQMLSNCSSLEFMEIARCDMLVSLGENGDLPLTLKHLKIGSCKGLLLLPRGLSETLSMNLISLEVSGCALVKSFPEGDLPPTIQQLVISDCSSLSSLPNGIHKLESLQSLEISACPLIKQFPEWGLPDSKLKSLWIKCCDNLTSLPIGFHNMGSLDVLEIIGCPELIYSNGLPYNLKILLLKDCDVLLSECPLELDSLSLLQILTIDNITGSVIFSDDNRLPYSLLELNLRSLSSLVLLPETPPATTGRPGGHSKLKSLYIMQCHEVKSMPKNGLPKTVAFLRVIKCKHLTPLCKGTYMERIQMIPNVEIE